MQTKEEAVTKLAGIHYEVEAGMDRIFRIESSADVELEPNEPIKLLEVNENTVAMGILPLRFGPIPSAGIYHSSIILEITPEEFEQVEKRELMLPEGWTVGELIARPLLGYGE